MNGKRLMLIVVVGALILSVFSALAAAEPSRNNPKRQDAVWEEPPITYDMTYLANGKVTVTIESPDVYMFEGSGTVVMWITEWREGSETPSQLHRVIKVVDGQIIWEKTTRISPNASLNVTDNPGQVRDNDDDEKDDGQMRETKPPKALRNPSIPPMIMDLLLTRALVP